MTKSESTKMMLITRTLGAAAVVATAGMGLAGAAHAAPPPFNGTYAGVDDDEMVWNVTSNCAGDNCTATVASNQGWTKVATFHDGRYHWIVTKPDGAICDDGSYAPAFITLSVDPVTLQGTVASDSNYGCPGGHIDQQPFALRKIG